jgi:nickel-dependent lactate racemase
MVSQISQENKYFQIIWRRFGELLRKKRKSGVFGTVLSLFFLIWEKIGKLWHRLKQRLFFKKNIGYIELQTGAWCGDTTLKLTVPYDWNLKIFKSRDLRSLSELEIESALSQPVGTKTLEELAHNKRNAVILVDDLSRPTPAKQVISHILKKLKAAGMKDGTISFVIAGGTHRGLTANELEKKLGSKILSKYKVYNHDAFSDDLVFLGNMEDGMPVYVNEIVMNSELKIGIGGVIPHGGAGFGGGSKIMCPGACGYATIRYLHEPDRYPLVGWGYVENPVDRKNFREKIDEVARFIGLDFVVNIVLTSKRTVGGLFAGDVTESYRKSAILAKKTYYTAIPKEDIDKCDIILINSYPIDYDPIAMDKAMWPVFLFHRGQKIVINPASGRVAYHGLADQGSYEEVMKRRPRPSGITNPAKRGKKMVSKDTFMLFSKNFPEIDDYNRYTIICPIPDDCAIYENWKYIIKYLKRLYYEPSVSVIPYSILQLLEIV